MPSQRQNPRNVSCRPSPLPDDIVSIPAVSPVISSHLHPSRHSLRAALVVVGTWPVRRAPHHHLVLASSKRSIPGGAARRGVASRLDPSLPLPRSYANANAGRRIGYRAAPPPVSLIWFLPLLPFGSRKQVRIAGVGGFSRF